MMTDTKALRYGLSCEHITGIWWVVRENGQRWPDEETSLVAGPFGTREEAARRLAQAIFVCTSGNSRSPK